MIEYDISQIDERYFVYWSVDQFFYLFRSKNEDKLYFCSLRSVNHFANVTERPKPKKVLIHKLLVIFVSDL